MLMRERSKSFANELLFVHQPGCCWLETGVWLIAPATSASGMPPLSGIPTAPLFLSQHPYFSHNTLISLPAPLFPQHFPPHEGSPAVERRSHLREEHMEAKGPWGQGEHTAEGSPHTHQHLPKKAELIFQPAFFSLLHPRASGPTRPPF